MAGSQESSSPTVGTRGHVTPKYWRVFAICRSHQVVVHVGACKGRPRQERWQLIQDSLGPGVMCARLQARGC